MDETWRTGVVLPARFTRSSAETLAPGKEADRGYLPAPADVPLEVEDFGVHDTEPADRPVRGGSGRGGSAPAVGKMMQAGAMSLARPQEPLGDRQYVPRKRMSSDAKFDLHAHTTASDGTLAPAELVGLAKRLGLSGIAVTDHDTTAGWAEAEAEGRRLGVEVIPGLEINTDGTEGEFHFLGYLVDGASRPFRQAIRRARDERWSRARAIVGRLREAGIRITDEDVLAAANGAPVCRPHIAAALAAAGYAATDREAFNRYLRGRSPFFVPHTGLTIPEAIAAIRAAGGVPVLGHPADLPVEAVLALKPLGLAGVEAYHPDHSPAVAAHWHQMARRHGLVATGGSDFHGADSVEPDRALGSFLAPGGAVEALRAVQERLTRGA